jgi:hypothetical protein
MKVAFVRPLRKHSGRRDGISNFIHPLKAEPLARETLCGKNAADWLLVEDWSESEICRACGKTLKAMRGIDEAFRKHYWSRVDRRSETECWYWICRNLKPGSGYGQVEVNGKRYGMHCMSWMLTCGPIPKGKKVCHTCDNPACCNPKHLFLGDTRDNAQDAARKGRLPTGERHGNAKLSDLQAIELRDRGQNGEKPKDLAVEFNVCSRTAWLIITERGWKHLRRIERCE